MSSKNESLPAIIQTQAVPMRVLSDLGTIYWTEISVEDWIAMPGHPRQRDTMRQAKRPHWRTAKQADGALQGVLRQVIAAEYMHKLYKVDGHTRAYLWSKQALHTPETVIATVHRVRSYDELMALYSVFDTASAAETLNDRVYGAFRQSGLVLRSKRLRDGFIVDALNIALRGCTRKDQDKRHTPEIDLYRAIQVFKDELLLLDTVDPQPEIFYGGIVAAALIALSLDPGDLEFFALLARREGNVRGRLKDPVQSILDEIFSLKHQRSAWVNAKQVDLCARTLRALTAWKAGSNNAEKYWLRHKVRAVEFVSMIDKVKRQKGIAGESCL